MVDVVHYKSSVDRGSQVLLCKAVEQHDNEKHINNWKENLQLIGRVCGLPRTVLANASRISVHLCRTHSTGEHRKLSHGANAKEYSTGPLCTLLGSAKILRIGKGRD